MNKFSARSKQRLRGVKAPLVKVANRAIQLSAVDFGITQGLRTLEQQRRYVQEGRSKTMRSRHLTGHAVDVVAHHEGVYTYEPFELYVDIAEGFRRAAIELDVEVMWGASWLRPLNEYLSAQSAMDDYVKARRAENRRPFMDGPHFQLTWRSHPE